MRVKGGWKLGSSHSVILTTTLFGFLQTFVIKMKCENSSCIRILHMLYFILQFFQTTCGVRIQLSFFFMYQWLFVSDPYIFFLNPSHILILRTVFVKMSQLMVYVRINYINNTSKKFLIGKYSQVTQIIKEIIT